MCVTCLGLNMHFKNLWKNKQDTHNAGDVRDRETYINLLSFVNWAM